MIKNLFHKYSYLFRLCGFEPKTINKYREIQDHLTNIHFRDKIEANLPQIRPFICPYYLEKDNQPCNYLGKDKQALLRHISKHGILEKYMEEELMAINTTTSGTISGSNSPAAAEWTDGRFHSKPVILDLKHQDHEIKQHENKNSTTSAGNISAGSSPLKSRLSRQFSEQPTSGGTGSGANPKMFKRSLSSNSSVADKKFVPKQKQILGTSLFTPVPSMDIVKCNSCHLQVARRFIKSHLLKCPGSGDLNVLTINGKSLQAAAEQMEYQQMSSNELIRRSILETKSGTTSGNTSGITSGITSEITSGITFGITSGITSEITSGNGRSDTSSILETKSGTTPSNNYGTTSGSSPLKSKLSRQYSEQPTSGTTRSANPKMFKRSLSSGGITSGKGGGSNNPEIGRNVEELVMEPSIIKLDESTTEEEIFEDDTDIPKMEILTNESFTPPQFDGKKSSIKKSLDRRRILNREAASKSRKRKNDYIRLLEVENKSIKAENEDLKKKINLLEKEKSECSWGLNELLSDDLFAITEKEAAALPAVLLPVPEVVASPAGISMKSKKKASTPNHFHEISREIDLIPIDFTKKNSVINQSIIDKINNVNRDISKKVEAATTTKEIRRVNPELPCISNPNTLMYQSHVLPNVANSMNKDQ